MYRIYTRTDSIDPEKQTLRDVLMSTQDVLLDGVAVREWDLTRYGANNVVLWQHGYEGADIFGHAFPQFDTVLHGDIQFLPDDHLPEAFRIRKQNYLEGHLRGVSVSFREISRLKGNEIRAELIELSLVTIPMDAKALAGGRMYVDAETDYTLLNRIEAIERRMSSMERERGSRIVDEMIKSLHNTEE
ncbi:MAG TPA: hypothetical protein VMX74_14720 [Pirellulales bacterium]|nr:hypothetical protein [Pirellulales bacterium]